MLWYFMLRAAASFVAERGRWPGSPVGTVPAMEGDGGASDGHFSAHVVELDLPGLRSHVNRVLTAGGVTINSVCDDYVHVG